MEEKLISRIRMAICLGMSLEEIDAQFDTVPSDLVYLYYHAAVILENDLKAAIGKE